MRLRCNVLLKGAIGFGLVASISPKNGFAQDRPQVAPAIVVVAQEALGMARLQAFPANAIPESRSNTAQRWIRGIIQNELNAIDALCELTPDQRQSFIDLAERQWKPRLVTTIKAYTEAQNQRIPVDFEYRVERLVMTWAGDILTEEQLAVWKEEIDGRLDMRRRVVVGRMVADVERKLGLTAKQMEMVSEILTERWKDSWWSMYRAGTLPEAKFAWISGVLSESQRTAGIDRSSQVLEQHFVQGGTVDLPSKSLSDRFEIAGLRSDDSIPLHEPDKEPGDADHQPEEQIFELGGDHESD